MRKTGANADPGGNKVDGDAVVLTLVVVVVVTVGVVVIDAAVVVCGSVVGFSVVVVDVDVLVGGAEVSMSGRVVKNVDDTSGLSFHVVSSSVDVDEPVPGASVCVVVTEPCDVVPAEVVVAAAVVVVVAIVVPDASGTRSWGKRGLVQAMS